MNPENDQTGKAQEKEQDNLSCSCIPDPFASLFASLPPDLRPGNRSVTDGLRKVTSAGCGLAYWTNRKTDLCMECEKKALQNPGD